MEDYNVTIKEILERVISVSAETPEEAEYMVRQDYKNQLHMESLFPFYARNYESRYISSYGSILLDENF